MRDSARRACGQGGRFGVAGWLLIGLVVWGLPQASRAQAPDVSALRTEARQATRDGRLEDAYGLLLQVAERTHDPAALLELAEAADHLRIDDVALSSYRAYLEAVPDAPRRRELEGRIAALVRVADGHDFGGTPSQMPDHIVDWQGRPLPRETSGLIGWVDDAPPRAVNYVVDWHGRPLRRQSPDLAPWQGSPTPTGAASRLARPY